MLHMNAPIPVLKYFNCLEMQTFDFMLSGEEIHAFLGLLGLSIFMSSFCYQCFLAEIFTFMFESNYV
jgi:hypothetical protein